MDRIISMGHGLSIWVASRSWPAKNDYLKTELVTMSNITQEARNEISAACTPEVKPSNVEQKFKVLDGLLSTLVDGTLNKDGSIVGQVATRSLELLQPLKDQFEKLRKPPGTQEPKIEMSKGQMQNPLLLRSLEDFGAEGFAQPEHRVATSQTAPTGHSQVQSGVPGSQAGAEAQVPQSQPGQVGLTQLQTSQSWTQPQPPIQASQLPAQGSFQQHQTQTQPPQSQAPGVFQYDSSYSSGLRPLPTQQHPPDHFTGFTSPSGLASQMSSMPPNSPVAHPQQSFGMLPPGGPAPSGFQSFPQQHGEHLQHGETVQHRQYSQPYFSRGATPSQPPLPWPGHSAPSTHLQPTPTSPFPPQPTWINRPQSVAPPGSNIQHGFNSQGQSGVTPNSPFPPHPASINRPQSVAPPGPNVQHGFNSQDQSGVSQWPQNAQGISPGHSTGNQGQPSGYGHGYGNNFGGQPQHDSSAGAGQ